MRIFALKKLVENQLKWGVFIAPTKFCPLAAGKGWNALPVDRAVDQPTIIFLTVEPTGRPARSTETGYREQSSLPVDQHGRPGPFPDSRALGQSIDPVDRPTSSSWRARLCTSVDRTGRPTSTTVDRSGRLADSQSSHYNGLKNLGFYL